VSRPRYLHGRKGDLKVMAGRGTGRRGGPSEGGRGPCAPLVRGRWTENWVFFTSESHFPIEGGPGGRVADNGTKPAKRGRIPGFSAGRRLGPTQKTKRVGSLSPFANFYVGKPRLFPPPSAGHRPGLVGPHAVVPQRARQPHAMVRPFPQVVML